MKIYIVVENYDVEYRPTVGAYSTKRRAKAAAKALGDSTVVEFEVDAPTEDQLY